MNIRVHIERLIVDEELTRGDAHGPRRSFSRELAGLLREGGLSQELRANVALSSARGRDIAVPARRTAAPLGSQVARAVYDVIGVPEGGQRR
jgi:hypothetical protein